MARPLRIEYEGALYHITARGNEKKPIFRDEEDCVRFLDIMGVFPERFGVVIHGYALMGNHYHLLVETPLGNISRAMHYLNTSYTVYFNRRRRRAGHLFQGRYKGFLLEKDAYLLSVSRYIHLNPVRAGLVERPEGYRWSSYRNYIGKARRCRWLSCSWILGQFSREETEARKLYAAFVREGMGEEENPFKALKWGLILGSEAFIDSIKTRTLIKRHKEIPQSRNLGKQVSVEEVVRAVGKRFGLTAEAIRERGRRNNQARKVCLFLLRTHTNMGNEEIASHFGIGYTAVSQASSRLKLEMLEDRSLRTAVETLEGLLCEE